MGIVKKPKKDTGILDVTLVDEYVCIVYRIVKRLIFKQHRSTRMRPVDIDRVAWSVCRSVCHTSEPYKKD